MMEGTPEGSAEHGSTPDDSLSFEEGIQLIAAFNMMQGDFDAEAQGFHMELDSAGEVPHSQNDADNSQEANDHIDDPAAAQQEAVSECASIVERIHHICLKSTQELLFIWKRNTETSGNRQRFYDRERGFIELGIEVSDDLEENAREIARASRIIKFDNIVSHWTNDESLNHLSPEEMINVREQRLQEGRLDGLGRYTIAAAGLLAAALQNKMEFSEDDLGLLFKDARKFCQSMDDRARTRQLEYLAAQTIGMGEESFS